jgi:hypothetical protein
LIIFLETQKMVLLFCIRKFFWKKIIKIFTILASSVSFLMLFIASQYILWLKFEGFSLIFPVQKFLEETLLAIIHFEIDYCDYSLSIFFPIVKSKVDILYFLFSDVQYFSKSQRCFVLITYWLCYACSWLCNYSW